MYIYSLKKKYCTNKAMQQLFHVLIGLIDVDDKTSVQF